jgi:hypothetical protein
MRLTCTQLHLVSSAFVSEWEYQHALQLLLNLSATEAQRFSHIFTYGPALRAWVRERTITLRRAAEAYTLDIHVAFDLSEQTTKMTGTLPAVIHRWDIHAAVQMFASYLDDHSPVVPPKAMNHFKVYSEDDLGQAVHSGIMMFL